jgi:hypothetical protein
VATRGRRVHEIRMILGIVAALSEPSIPGFVPRGLRDQRFDWKERWENSAHSTFGARGHLPQPINVMRIWSRVSSRVQIRHIDVSTQREASPSQLKCLSGRGVRPRQLPQELFPPHRPDFYPYGDNGKGLAWFQPRCRLICGGPSVLDQFLETRGTGLRTA